MNDVATDASMWLSSLPSHVKDRYGSQLVSKLTSELYSARSTGHSKGARIKELYKSLETTEDLLFRMLSCLKLIAEPQLPDGSWRHDREGCQHLAERAIDLLDGKFGRLCCDPGTRGVAGEAGIPG